MNSICIFCGSSSGYNSSYMEKALALGQYLAANHIDIIYGGAKVGLMGAVADGALSENGKVIGVIPRFLGAKEIIHESLTELIHTQTMHERKTKMHELSEGVVVLPGGFGTMDEVFEMLTWAQLGLHQKPVGILNWNGFYNHLLQQIQNMVEEGFLKPMHQNMVIVEKDISTLIYHMNTYIAPEIPKWLGREEI